MNNGNNRNNQNDESRKTFRVTISDEDYSSGSDYDYRQQEQRYYTPNRQQNGGYRPQGQNPAYRGQNGQRGQARNNAYEQKSVRSAVPARPARSENPQMQQYRQPMQPQLTRTRTVTTRTGERFEIPEETAIPPKIMRKNSKNTKSKGCVIALVYAAIVCSISALLSFYIIVGLNDMFGLVKEESEITIDVPKDATLDEVTRILDDNGIVDYPFFFKIYAGFTNDTSFKAGTFVLNTKSDYDQIIRKLTKPATADNSIVKVTIPEGYTVEQIGALLEEYCVCEKQAFINSVQYADFSSYDFVNYIPADENKIYRLEGYLFPSTYDFYIWGGSKHAIGKLLAAFEDNVLKDSDYDFDAVTNDSSISKEKRNEKKVSLGKKLDKVIIMASVVEREVPDPEDMKKVASVFNNRLKNPSVQGTGGMLQSDATRWYPFATATALRESEFITTSQKENWIENHKGSYTMTATNPVTSESFTKTFDTSLYDTYVVAGLPVGPICCPGMNSIKAAISPAETSYYFFYSKSDGTTLFAENYDQHLSNIRSAS